MKSVLRGTVKVNKGGRRDGDWLRLARVSGCVHSLPFPATGKRRIAGSDSLTSDLVRRLSRDYPAGHGSLLVLGLAKGFALCRQQRTPSIRRGPGPVLAPPFPSGCRGGGGGGGRTLTTAKEGGAGGRARLGAWVPGGVAAWDWLTVSSLPPLPLEIKSRVLASLFKQWDEKRLHSSPSSSLLSFG